MKNKLLKSVVLLAVIAIMLSTFASCMTSGNANSVPNAQAVSETGWEYEDHELIIKDGGMVTTAQKPEDIPWNTIAASVQTVVFEGENHTAIGAYAFHGMRNLTDIKIPSTVTRIDKCAFAFCSSLTTISLNGINEIGESAFEACVELKDVTVTPPSATEEATTPSVKLGARAFAFCRSLKKLKVIGTIEEIKDETFRNCAALSTIEMSKAPATTSSSAFKGLSSSVKVTEIPSLGKAATVTVKHVDADGNSLKDDEIKNSTIGAELTVNAPNIDGYTVTKDHKSQTITVSKETETVTLKYTKNVEEEKPAADPEPEKEPMKTWQKVLLIVILVAVLAAIIVGIVLFTRNSKKPTSSTVRKNDKKTDKKSKK